MPIYQKITLSMMLLISSFAFAGDVTNSEVKKFIDNAELCEHFLGEIDNNVSKKEEEQMITSANKYCDRSKMQMRNLISKYPHDENIKKILSQYQDVLSD